MTQDYTIQEFDPSENTSDNSYKSSIFTKEIVGNLTLANLSAGVQGIACTAFLVSLVACSIISVGKALDSENNFWTKFALLGVSTAAFFTPITNFLDKKEEQERKAALDYHNSLADDEDYDDDDLLDNEYWQRVNENFKQYLESLQADAAPPQETVESLWLEVYDYDQ